MTSKFKLKLIRGDGDVDNMPSVDEADFVSEPIFTRPSFLETVNDVKVQHAMRIWRKFVCVPDPDMAWDEDVSAETVGFDQAVAIAITGLNWPFTWEVEGEGFYLDSGRLIKTIETEDVSAVLYTDDTACGTATITVTGCDGRSVTGYVVSTEGQWIEVSQNV